MSWIAFEMTEKAEILEAYRSWQSQLPKEEGQIGSEIVGSVEGPPIGAQVTFNPFITTNAASVESPPIRAEVTLAVDPRFVKFLKDKSFVFREV